MNQIRSAAVKPETTGKAKAKMESTAQQHYPCPQCGMLAGADQCEYCGRGNEALLRSLAELDSAITTHYREIGELNNRLSALSQRLGQLRYQRKTVAAQLTRTAIERQASPPPSTPPSPPRQYTAPPAVVTQPETKRETSTRSIQNVLLMLGGVLSATAIIVFTVVAWTTFGPWGRMGILLGVTSLVMIAPLWSWHHRLNATTETLAGLASLLAPCDAIALYYLELLPGGGDAAELPRTKLFEVATHALTQGIHTPTFLFGLFAVTAIVLGYRLATRLVAPGYAVFVLGGVTIGLAFTQSNPVLGVGALLGVAATQALTSWVLCQRPAHHGRAAAEVLIALTSGIAAVAMLFAAMRGAQQAASNATAFARGEHVLLATTVCAALLLVLSRRLPSRWRTGPLNVSLVTTWIAASLAALLAANTTIFSLAAPPRFTESSSAMLTAGFIVTMLVATLTTSSLVATRHRTGVLMGGMVGTALIAPQAFELPPHIAAPLLAFIATASCLIALRRGVLSRPALCAAAPLALIAMLWAREDLANASLTAWVLTVGFGLSAALSARSGRYAYFGLIIGFFAWCASGALLLTGHLADMPVTTMSAIAFLVTALLLGALPTGLAGAARDSVWHHAVPWLFGASLFTPLTVAVAALRLFHLPVFGLCALLLLAAGCGVTAMLWRRTPNNITLAAQLAAVALIAALAAFGWLSSNGYALGWYALASIVVTTGTLKLPREAARGASHGCRLFGSVIAVLTGIAGLSAAATTLSWPPLFWMDDSTPIVLTLLGLAAFGLLPRVFRVNVGIVLIALSLVSVAGAWDAVWWLGPWLSVAATVLASTATLLTRDPGSRAIRGAVALLSAVWALYAALRHPGAPDAASTYALAATIGFALLGVCVSLAFIGYRNARAVGGVAVVVGLMLLPLSTVFQANAVSLEAQQVQLAAMAMACLGLLIAAGMRSVAVGYMPWATLAVPAVALACARADAPSTQSPLYIAVAALIGVGAAMLMLPDKRAAAIRTGLSSIAVVLTMAAVAYIPTWALSAAHQWNGLWNGAPSSTLDAGRALHAIISATGSDLVVLAAGLLAIALATLGLAGRGWAIPVTVTALSMFLPSVPVVFDLAWPILPFTLLVIAVTSYLLASHLRLRGEQLAVLGVVAGICALSGIVGALPTRASTLIALAVCGIGTVSGATLGASLPRRTTGWLLSASSLGGLALAAGFAADLPTGLVSYGVMAIAAGFVALASAQAGFVGRANWAVELGGHLLASVAIALGVIAAAGPEPVYRLAITLVIYGALLGLLALRAPRRAAEAGLFVARSSYAVGAGATALVAYWLLLRQAQVSTVEVYTVPFALATMLAGWLESRRRPRLSSWIAYGPGLLLGLLPPLAQVLLTEDEPLRRLALGIASLVVVLWGAKWRLQAPVVTAVGMLLIHSGYELTLLWTLVPSWLPLAIGGVSLLTLGATFEKRRRDLRRLRGAVAAMR